jgi:hypothetical protein
MVAAYTANGASFAPDNPRVWSPLPIWRASFYWNFDVAADGKRIVAFPAETMGTEQAGNIHVTVLLNFFDELKRRLP